MIDRKVSIIGIIGDLGDLRTLVGIRIENIYLYIACVEIICWDYDETLPINTIRPPLLPLLSAKSLLSALTNPKLP